jgi:hypothetical protein
MSAEDKSKFFMRSLMVFLVMIPAEAIDFDRRKVEK